MRHATTFLYLPQIYKPMGSISAARELRQFQVSDAPTHLAKVLPFRGRKPGPEMPSFKPAENTNNANVSFMKVEAAKSSLKDKGVLRRSAEPPNDHWLIAWVVWSYYISVYTRAGLRVDDESKRYEYHKRTATRT